MARKPGKPKQLKQVEALKHEEASRKNIPTAGVQSVMPSSVIGLRVDGSARFGALRYSRE
ncbi:MAG: hypothetical protein NDJ92_14890 [Thermoanaerobaculia bacterium]|nr:hypothetical protein [Thermoanaerobaculia bacterium]